MKREKRVSLYSGRSSAEFECQFLPRLRCHQLLSYAYGVVEVVSGVLGSSRTRCMFSLFLNPNKHLTWLANNQLDHKTTEGKRRRVRMNAKPEDNLVTSRPLSPALARKRRREARRKSHDSHSSTISSISVDPASVITKKDSYLQRNTQVRYSPDVAMTEEELAAWRRNQRRIRNRDSAAMTRRKTRELIANLQNDANEWKRKYEKLEDENKSLRDYFKSRGLVIPENVPKVLVKREDHNKGIVSPYSSPVLAAKNPVTSTDVLATPALVVSQSIGASLLPPGMMIVQQRNQPTQHLIEMISRPA